VADWPQKWPIKSLIVQLLKSCPHLHTFEFFLVNQNFQPKSFRVERRGPASHSRHLLFVYLCVTWTHITCGYRQVMRVPARVTLPNRRRSNNNSNNNRLFSSKCFFKMMMIIVDLFPRDFTFKCGTGMK
jgi:hypothetical protein